jgi:hypothetical protein
MKNLIIPAAGLSKRFPNMRPKWTLTHPNGNMMFTESVSGLNLEEFDNIYIVVLQKILSDYPGIKEGIFNNFKERYNKEIKIIELDRETKSQSETLYLAIKKEKISGSIFSKDSDGYFIGNKFDENSLTYCSMVDYDLKKPQNKSYIIFDEEKNILNVVEKQIISKYFCVGGYFFKDVNKFCETYEKLKHLEEISELYLSTIVSQLMLDGEKFKAKHVEDFVDWGTLEDWSQFKSKFNTYFIDIDGVLFKNASKFFNPIWGESDPLYKNIDIIKNLNKSKTNQIILVTSRSESFKEQTIKQLNEVGIKYDKIIFDLQHSKRIIINDFSTTNFYPTCESINIERDRDNLNLFIK